MGMGMLMVCISSGVEGECGGIFMVWFGKHALNGRERLVMGNRSGWQIAGKVEGHSAVQRLNWMTLCGSVPRQASFVLRGDFSGLVEKSDGPVVDRCHDGWRFDRRVDKVEPQPALAGSVRLSAILTYRKAFIAFQVTFAASQTTRPHPLWLAHRLARFGSMASTLSAGHTGAAHGRVHSRTATPAELVARCDLLAVLPGWWTGRSGAVSFVTVGCTISDKREIGSCRRRDAWILRIEVRVGLHQPGSLVGGRHGGWRVGTIRRSKFWPNSMTFGLWRVLAVINDDVTRVAGNGDYGSITGWMGREQRESGRAGESRRG